MDGTLVAGSLEEETTLEEAPENLMLPSGSEEEEEGQKGATLLRDSLWEKSVMFPLKDEEEEEEEKKPGM